MEFFTNLLRKLRRPKTETTETLKNLRLIEQETLRKQRILDEINRPRKQRHFQGDIFNGWEHDGEPKAWHSNYLDRRKK